MGRRIFRLTVLFLLTAWPVMAQDWETDLWRGRLQTAPSDPRGALIWSWTQDDRVAMVEQTEAYLKADPPKELGELYWRISLRKALELGDLDSLARLAEMGRQDVGRDAQATVHQARGETDKARAVWDSMNFVRAWKVIGPFNNTADSGFDQAFPPEQAGPMSGQFAGASGRPLQWRPLKEVRWNGWCELERFLEGDQENTYYAATAVRSEGEREVRLGLDRSGAAKIWLNGQLVFQDDSYRSRVDFTPNLEQIPVQLTSGWNTILVKSNSNSDVESAFRLSLASEGSSQWEADPERAVLRNLSQNTAPEAQVPILEAAQALPQGPERAILESRWLAYLGRYREAAELLRDSHQAHPDMPWLAWCTFRAYQVAGFDSEADTLFASFADLEDGPTALMAMKVSKTPDKPTRLAQARKLVKQYPRSPIAHLEAFGSCLRANLESEALDHLENAMALSPGSYNLDNYATMMARMRRSQQARQRVEKALESRPGDVSLLRTAANLAIAQDQTEQALAYVQRALDGGGLQSVYYATRGRLEQKEKKWAEAAKSYEEATQYSPQSAALWESLGDIRKELDLNKEAAEAYRLSLDYAPSSRVRSKLADVADTDKVADLIKPLDLEPLLKQAEAAPISSGARIILDDGIVIVWPDGSYEERFRMVYEVQDQETAKGLQRLPRDFSGQGENVQIYRAAVIKPDGKEVDATDHVDQAGFRFPSLSAGDRLEIEYLLHGRKSGGWESSYWTQWFFDGEYPCLHSRLSLITPKDFDFQYQTHGGAPQPTKQVEGDWAVTQWNMKEIEKLNLAGASVPQRDLSSWVDVSTVPDWTTVARWYHDLAADRCQADGSTRAKAAELTRGVTSERDKIRVLRDYLARDLQYQTTPFRNSAFVPTEGSKVIEEGYGDCKDKAAMLVAMLKEVGITSRIALVSGRDGGVTDFLPSPRFNHAINVIETSQGPLWVDATSPMLPFDMLDSSLYGARALVIDPQTTGLQSIPPSDVSRDRVRSEVEGKLSESGDLSGSMTLVFEGNPANRMRALLARLPEDGRERALTLALPRLLDQAQASKVSVEKLEEFDLPLTLTFQFDMPGAAKLAGSILICDPPWCEATRFKSTLNAVQDLEGALESAGARAQRSATTRLELPAGWKVLESPPSASGESPFGKFELNSELKDQVLSMELSSQLLPLRVEDDQTAAYTAFLQQHEKALGQPLVLRKE